jgi:hypothetical protein
MSLAKINFSFNGLSKTQTETLMKFKKRLARKLPNFHIAWVKPVKENMIELHLETEKRTYRNSRQAVKLAIDVEDETGVIIILR